MLTAKDWNELLSHVISSAPWIEKRLEEIRRRTWCLPTNADAQANLLLICLDLDLDDYRHRSKAKQLLEAIDSQLSGGRGGVAPGWTLVERLPEKHRELLLKSLAWAGAVDLSRFESSSSEEAVGIVWREAPSLKGFRAYLWLGSLGFSVATPDSARQRFLFRMGWIPEVSRSDGARREGFRVMQRLSEEVESPLREVDLIVGLFTGAVEDGGMDAAVCLPEPRCELCPLTGQCVWFRMTRSARAKSAGAVSDVMRDEDQPRHRIRLEGADSLTVPELLSIILRPSQGSPSSQHLAHQLLGEAGSLRRLSEMSFAELAGFPGIGPGNAVVIKATLGICRHFGGEEAFGVGHKFLSADAVFDHFRPRFIGRKQEEFLCAHLDARLKVLRIVSVSKGLLNHTPADPREVFKEAIRDSANSVIVIHNHPSGNPEPSRADRELTALLEKAGALLGIELIDHIIIGEHGYYSFAKEGELAVSP